MLAFPSSLFEKFHFQVLKVDLNNFTQRLFTVLASKINSVASFEFLVVLFLVSLYFIFHCFLKFAFHVVLHALSGCYVELAPLLRSPPLGGDLRSVSNYVLCHQHRIELCLSLQRCVGCFFELLGAHAPSPFSLAVLGASQFPYSCHMILNPWFSHSPRLAASAGMLGFCSRPFGGSRFRFLSGRLGWQVGRWLSSHRGSRVFLLPLNYSVVNCGLGENFSSPAIIL